MLGGSAQSPSSFLTNVPGKADGYVLTAQSSSPSGYEWTPGGGGGSGGVSGLGTFDSQSPSAYGGAIVGTLLYMQSASASVPGMVNTGTQTFAGSKIFSGAIALGSSLQIHINTVSNNYSIS